MFLRHFFALILPVLCFVSVFAVADLPAPGELRAATREYLGQPRLGKARPAPTENNVEIHIATLPLGPVTGNNLGPAEIALDPARNRAYVSSQFSDSVAVIDTRVGAVVGDIPTGMHPLGIAFDPEMELLFVACNRSDRMDILAASDSTFLGYVPVGPSPQGLAFDPGRDVVYVGNTGDDTLTVIDFIAGTTATVPVGGFPFAVRYSAAFDRVYVSNAGDGTISVLDPATHAVIATATTGQVAHRLRLRRGGRSRLCLALQRQRGHSRCLG